MKKKLFIILSLALVLSACNKNDNYKPGNVNNKENETVETKVEKTTENAENVKIGENQTKSETESEVEKSKRLVEIKKKNAIFKAKINNTKKRKLVEKDLKKGTTEASNEIKGNVDKLLTQLVDIANKSKVKDYNLEEENVIKVANNILSGQRNESYTLMGNIKHLGFKPYLTNAKKVDEENYIIELTFRKNDEDMIVYSGYYNKAGDMISIRNQYETDKGVEYLINYSFENGKGI